MTDRMCEIVGGSVELENGAGDGAYDLFHVVGTPDDIGTAIAESLKECDLFGGGTRSMIEAEQDLYLNVRIKIARIHEAEGGRPARPKERRKKGRPQLRW
jgi:hypothetical protein